MRASASGSTTGKRPRAEDRLMMQDDGKVQTGRERSAKDPRKIRKGEEAGLKCTDSEAAPYAGEEELQTQPRAKGKNEPEEFDDPAKDRAHELLLALQNRVLTPKKAGSVGTVEDR